MTNWGDWTEETVAEAMKANPELSIQGDPMPCPGTITGATWSKLPSGMKMFDKVEHMGTELAPGISEKDFQKQIIEVAHLFGWKIATFRPARVMRNGKEIYETPVGADGKGFVDLILVHPKRREFIAVEVKTDKGKLTPEQEAWQRALITCVHTEVWRPLMFDRIVERLKG